MSYKRIIISKFKKVNWINDIIEFPFNFLYYVTNDCQDLLLRRNTKKITDLYYFERIYNYFYDFSVFFNIEDKFKDESEIFKYNVAYSIKSILNLPNVFDNSYLVYKVIDFLKADFYSNHNLNLDRIRKIFSFYEKIYIPLYNALYISIINTMYPKKRVEKIYNVLTESFTLDYIYDRSKEYYINNEGWNSALYEDESIMNNIFSINYTDYKCNKDIKKYLNSYFDDKKNLSLFRNIIQMTNGNFNYKICTFDELMNDFYGTGFRQLCIKSQELKCKNSESYSDYANILKDFLDGYFY
ncbi:hypothetical protein JYG23_08805 [Sedimentibacter sp. zth1]|uniref:hypothetical protein n=1 Tax=Sedimentibacter sp. zth1 TaxID=2816908 RepID=UPI001A937E01|nr:hypothetical protein [Sedimentibacter sp. zth1]QSX04805.1 hypothetical protein JYG23_08805 [Sedimentibacter sp. zth1]